MNVNWPKYDVEFLNKASIVQYGGKVNIQLMNM